MTTQPSTTDAPAPQAEISEKTRDPKAVFLARRELLLDAITEGCGDAIEYAESAQLFICQRDRAAMFPAIDGLIAKAIAVGAAAVDLRKLLTDPAAASASAVDALDEG
jgi:hypothetical protein